MIFIRNLMRSRMRTIMTIVGCAVGIAVFVAITAIVGDLRKESQHMIERYSGDITIQSSGAPMPLASRISSHDVSRLREQFGNDASPVIIASLREPWSSYLMVLGADSSLIGRFGLVEGNQLASSNDEVVVGELLARRHRLAPGELITLGGVSHRISGVFNSGNRLIDGGIAVNLSLAQRLTGKDSVYNLVLLKVRDKRQIAATIQEIETRFPTLKAQSGSNFVANIRLFKAIETFSTAVALISCIGACLIVSNTLAMAVHERIREIGILSAIGWSPFLILRMLAAESIALCSAGALTGNALALLILFLISRSSAIGSGWIPTQISLESAILSFVLAIALGCVALVWPAIIIYRILPAEALRHE